MAITLLSIAIVLLLSAAIPEAAQSRQFEFQNQIARAMHQRLKANGFWHGLFGPLLAIAPAVAVVALLQYLLIGQLHGLLSFVFGMVMFFYALGPRDLADDLNELSHAHLAAQRVQAQRAFGVTSEKPLPPTQLIEPIFRAALKRKFAVIFWFVVFGAAGALAYRWMQLLADTKLDSRKDTVPPPAELAPESAPESLSIGFVESAQHVEAALAWMPAQLMCAALALASDFDAVARGWREHQQSHQRGWIDVDLGFLASTAKACMDIDDVDEVPRSELADQTGAMPFDDTAPIHHAQQLLGRITVAWLLALAVLVMAAYLA